MKPDWKDAPEWAQYLAMDEEGTWFWFEKEPYKEGVVWWEPGGRLQAAFCINDWQESLEQRP